EVGDGWFEILLPSLQLVVTAQVPVHLRAKAENTLNRLRLRDHQEIIKVRTSWYELYEAGELTLSGLERRAPLIAAAVRKQQTAQAAPKPNKKLTPNIPKKPKKP